MEENEQRRTAKELFERAEGISRLIRRVHETLKLPNLTEAQTRDIDLIPQRIGGSIKAIREAAIAEGSTLVRIGTALFGARLQKVEVGSA